MAEKNLPQLIIRGTTFCVDVRELCLFEKDHADNKILFDDLVYHKNHYSLEFDLNTKGVPAAGNLDTTAIKKIRIPHFSVLDPEGIAAKYHLTAMAVKLQKDDFKIMVDWMLLGKRELGFLPVVEIADQDYLFDYTLDELRMRGNPNKTIPLSRLDWFLEEQLYRGFYDIEKRELHDYSNPATLREVPKNTVMLEIPANFILDPVAYARDTGRDMKNAVIHAPPVELRIIRTVPIEQTNIPKLVANNLQRDHKLKAPKKRRGLGL